MMPYEARVHVDPNLALHVPRRLSSLGSLVRPWNRLGWKVLELQRGSGQPPLEDLILKVNGATSLFDSLNWGTSNGGRLGLDGSNNVYLSSTYWANFVTCASFFNSDYVAMVRLKNQTSGTLYFILAKWEMAMASPWLVAGETTVSTGHSLATAGEVTIALPGYVSTTAGYGQGPWFNFQKRRPWAASTYPFNWGFALERW